MEMSQYTGQENAWWLSVLMQKLWGHVILSANPSHLWELGNKDRGLMGLKDIYLLQLSANFVKIELSPWITKYSPGRRFSTKKMKIITLALSTESALFVLTAVAKGEGRKEQKKERRREWQCFLLCPKGSIIFIVRLRAWVLNYPQYCHILSVYPAVASLTMLISGGN